MSPFETCLEGFAGRASEVRHDLRVTDITPLTRSASKRLLAYRIRAGAYVWLAAELELFVRQFFTDLFDEVNAIGLMHRDLSPGLAAVASAERFQSLQDLRGLKMWERRYEVVATALDAKVATLRPENGPLDGRTIRPSHLDAIWTILDFPGSSAPGPLHRIALSEVADLRNDLAHGNIEPVAVGRLKTRHDVDRAIVLIEDIALHIAAAGEAYLTSAAYRR